MKSTFTSVITILAFFCSYAQSQYSTLFDIPYSEKADTYSKEKLKLDVHHKADGQDMPVIVWFHGGGLTGGNKCVPAELMERGYVVVAPNYRLIPNVGVEECIDDAAEAERLYVANDETGRPSRRKDLQARRLQPR